MSILAFLFAVTLDTESICDKYKHYTLPPVGAKALEVCGGDSSCYVDVAVELANGAYVEEGQKVPPEQFDIAESLLCQAPIAQAELEGMLEHIAAMRSGEAIEPLDFCNFATSSYGSMICASREEDDVMPELEARLDALRERSKVQKEFDELRKRGDAFAEAEAQRIGDQSRRGTGYAAISIGERMEKHQHFVETFERWTKQRAPAASAASVKKADEALNAAYRAYMKSITDSGDEEMQEWKTFMRDAQRAWIPYRDAFAAYYVARWKGAASPDALRREIVAQLTRDRTAVVRKETQ
jgi:uncharacterized protein YecT (DUF1311 family)